MKPTRMVDAECPQCGCDVFTPFAFGIIGGAEYPEPQAHLTAFCERCGGILVGRAVTELAGDDKLEMTMAVAEFVAPAHNPETVQEWYDGTGRL